MLLIPDRESSFDSEPVVTQSHRRGTGHRDAHVSGKKGDMSAFGSALVGGVIGFVGGEYLSNKFNAEGEAQVLRANRVAASLEAALGNASPSVGGEEGAGAVKVDINVSAAPRHVGKEHLVSSWNSLVSTVVDKSMSAINSMI